MREMGISFEEVQSVDQDFEWLAKYKPGFSDKYLLSVDTSPLRRSIDNADLTDRRNDVLSRLLAAISETTLLNAEILAYEVEQMTAQYEEVGQQARAAKKAYDRLSPKIAQYEQFADDAMRQFKRESLNLEALKTGRPSAWDFPTRAEQIHYEKELKQQETIVEDARIHGNETQSKLAELVAEQNEHGSEYNNAAKKYSRLMSRLAILQGNGEGAKGKKVKGQFLFQR